MNHFTVISPIEEPPDRFAAPFSIRSFKIPLDMVSILHYLWGV